MNISARYNRLWIKFFENLRNRDLRESTEVMCDLRINDDFYFVYLIVMRQLKRQQPTTLTVRK